MYKMEEKEEILIYFLTHQDEKVKTICEKFVISVSTLYNWLKMYHYKEVKQDITQIYSYFCQEKFLEIEKLSKDSKNNYLLELLFKYVEKYNRKLEENKTVLDECDQNFCREDLKILSQKAKIYLKLGENEKVLELCTEERCRKNLALQSQKITALINLGRYKEALAECNKDFCKNDKDINLKKRQILKEFKQIDEESKENVCSVMFSSKEEKLNITKDLLEKIYRGIFNIDELSVANLSEFERIIIETAYREKGRKESGISYLKRQIKRVALNDEEKKQAKKCLEEIGRIKYFDITIYQRILLNGKTYFYTHVEKPLVSNTFTQPTENSNQMIQLSSDKKSETANKPITKEFPKKNVEQPTISNTPIITPVIPSKKKKPKEKTKEVTVKTLNYKYYKQVLELKKMLYVAMNDLKNNTLAIKAYDILEDIVEQPETDQLAEERLLRMLSKIKK